MLLQVRTLLSLILIVSTFSLLGCGQNKVKKSESVLLSQSIANDKKTPSVLYRSIDSGIIWKSFSNGIPYDATVSGIEQFDDKIYITTDFHGVFVSQGGENNWNPINNGLPKNIDVNCISVSDGKIAIGSLRQGVYISNDGSNWKVASNNISNTAVRAFFKTDEKLIAGTDDGFYISDDFGNSWLHLFGDMQILGFTSLDNKLFAAAHNGALISYDMGITWDYIYESDALHDISNDGQYVYAMTIGQQLLRTKDDGVTWENAQSNIDYPVNFYTNELRADGTNIYSAQWIGVYHSVNGGNNWRLIPDLPDSTAFSTLEITDYGILAGISIR
ncbi:MAG: hypothetical protein AAF363_10450 [Bacteroidota bacterium]